ncbi:DUF4381 domain-containing protein [Phaeobacter sp. HF9A]|uniref:DUF4381 domain-containing protein n=1 Tax=Phaeobacter sp. HF9A TaxID=2721561 RepID=UPI0014320EF6|nr:DUF4381 domain-containing protein [Phaeobacter sp. HF9A]NIZ12038.1 DUF4381 domain-containing protein [Phaeobacter sp. HF9A]
MTPEIEAQLAQLRDIRLPDPVGWWPLAYGWWLALALVCAALLAGRVYARWRKQTARARALRELAAIPGDDPQGFATAVSILLRRVARRKDALAAQLSGKPWADYLAQKGLRADLASYLAEATYAPGGADTPTDDTLRNAAAHWIRRQT